MGTAVNRIVELLTEVFEKESWQAPLTASLDGLTARQAAWTPAGLRNSIWMIVNHLSLWKEYYAGRLAGEPPRPSGWAEKVDWQPISDTSDEAWQAALSRLQSAQNHFLAAMKKRSDEDLERPLPGGKTPMYHVQAMAPHDAYHCGQIRLLRALQGVPAKPY